LIFPNPFFEDYACNNVDVENYKDYLKITPINFKQPPQPYWISFAINKGFEGVNLSKIYKLYLKGTFNDTVTIRFDKDVPIQLKEKINEYEIPLSKSNIKAINIQGELDQSIFIEHLSIKHSLYKTPNKKKKIFFITNPRYPDNNVLRKGEKDVFEYIETINDINKIDDDTIVYVRPIDELVTKKDYENIIKQLDEIKLKSKAKIINDIKYFYNYKIKNFTFDIWQKNNIPFSEYQIIKEEQDIYKFLDKYEKAILRINEGWGSKNSYAINKESKISDIFKQLIVYKNKQIENGYNNVDIIISRKILPVKYKDNLILNLGRCFVVNNEILNIHSFVHRMHDDNQLTGSVASDEDFIEAHRRVLEIQNNYKDLLINSVKCLGLQVGCIDFLIEDNKPIFLEINACWGMGMGTISYPYSKN